MMSQMERAEPVDRDTTRTVGLIRRATTRARRQANKNRLFASNGVR